MVGAEYRVRVEYRTREDVDDALLKALASYSPATGRSPRGWVEVYLTVPAGDFVQLAQTTLAIAAAALGAPVQAVDLMLKEEFDARVGLDPVPELLSVSQAAEALDVTRQAVLQRIEGHTLPATRIGNAWAVHGAHIRREVSEAERAALAAVESTARSLGQGSVSTSIVRMHCDRCDRVHGLAVAQRPDASGSRVLEICWCPRARTIVQGSHRPDSE